MNRAILAEGGTVMQYVGDAVMAVFGAPEASADHADRALDAALAMHRAQQAVNEEWATEGLAPFGLGIGLSTGVVAAALLGSEERVEYTLVGDAVNLCQRLQQFAEPGETVLSEPTWDSLSITPATAEKLEPQVVKGRDTPVVAYRLAARNRRGTRQHDRDGRGPARKRHRGRPHRSRSRCGRRTARSNRTPRRCGPCAAPTCRSRRGEFVAVMGPSGCGKSTLLNLIAGLDVPDEGEVVIAGESLAGKDENAPGDHAPPARRHRVPVLQPARGHDGAGERRACRR